MRARIIVRLKPTVHDPQGEAILQSLHHLNYSTVASVRQGKEFDLELGDIPKAEAEVLLDEIARKVLANPIIEQYAIELE
ncbi:MAG TPA: phosphoribosylformylglycinamidine synthase subunit PurS [Acidobacteriota bacterium]|jgi:phosphoribosylformylglycinamidine synthase|nr:phosphoribosylformylglycinamidine synthase subunit PurS [Acidobacteriota bacterium]